jgi:tRNA(Leu) C34 or U34 (ribose-2'-O)-methylase TrmL
MIDPPVVSMEEDGEGRREGPQKQITRTPEELEQRRLHHLFAQNATEWLTVEDFPTTEDCIAFCRKEGYKLWVTDLSQEAEALDIHCSDRTEMPEKIALVFGTEAVGASTPMLEQADKRIYLPLRGYADSLNLSVATALITQALFFMDPTLIGAMSENERMSLRTSWFTKLAQQRILSSTQKRNRKKLTGQLKKCETIQKRMKDDPDYHIQPSEQKKLDEWSSYKCKLEALEALIDPEKVQKGEFYTRKRSFRVLS